MTVSVVLADANILFSRTLRDYFLYAADAGAIEVHWSQQILDEMSRNLRGRLRLDQAATDHLEALMNDYLEDALVEVGVDALATAAGVTMDAKDRHVLAAALSADADVLVTENTRHFPQAWMMENGIELMNAGQLLTRLSETHPDKILQAHQKTIRNSSRSEAEILTTLEKIVGNAVANRIRSLSQAAVDGGMPTKSGAVSPAGDERL
ncbi:MAG: PIN domain-containing protein [Micropruina sp.]|uniref:PIN domain-containing protein n=1 Tax=Micropruina sp. TaxID=2737536 RepID=UPI0039E4236E